MQGTIESKMLMSHSMHIVFFSLLLINVLRPA